MLTNQAHANMANHYNVLWPYFHNVSALNYNNPDMPMIQASLTPQIGTMCSDVTSLPPGDQIITNIAFQQHQQQKQHQQHQQQLQYFQQQQQQQQHQQQHQQPNIKLPPTNPDRDAYLRKLGYEFATNFGSTRSLPMLNKASLDNETNNNNFTNNKEKMMSGINNLNEIPHTKANNHKSKKGSSFTIDYILSNDKSKNSEKETTDDESIDDSQSTPSIDEQSNQRSDSPRNNVHSPTTPMDINNSPATLPVLPLMHSTPNSLHSEKARYSRRHDRFTEISHPYFQKQFDFLSQHAPPSFQLPPNQHHNSHEQQRQHHPHHPHQLHQQHLISHPTPLHHHPHQQNNSPRNTLTPSTSSDSPSTTFSSSSSESMTSPRTETKEGKMSSKAKRIRTIFTPDQLERLEAEFERQQYMVGTERFYLASSLNLTEAQVKVWFQNRRIKWRKQHLEQQQARLAQGDLYRDLDDSEDESEPERDNEATSSMMSISGLQEEDGERSNFIQHKDNSLMEDDV